MSRRFAADAGGTEIVVTSTLSLSRNGKTLTEIDKLSAGGNDVPQRRRASNFSSDQKSHRSRENQTRR
jgi:hypothetical protein